MAQRTFVSQWKKDLRFFLPFCILFLVALMIWPTKEFQKTSWWEWFILLGLAPVIIAISTASNLASDKLREKLSIKTDHHTLDVQKKRPMYWAIEAILLFLLSLFFRGEEGWPSKGLFWAFRGLAIGSLLIAFLIPLTNLLEKAARRLQPPQ